MTQLFLKGPKDRLDYIFDWYDDGDGWLATSETILSYTLTVQIGITKDSDSEANGVVTVWLSGGTAGQKYTVDCKIETNAARIVERTITIICREL